MKLLRKLEALKDQASQLQADWSEIHDRRNVDYTQGLSSSLVCLCLWLLGRRAVW